MKVLVCHNYYQKTSGEDLVIADDLRILRKNAVECIEYSRNNKEIEEYSLYQRSMFPLKTIFSFRTDREIEKIVNEHRPDVAFVQNVLPLISPSVYYVLSRLRIPIVQLVYNYRLICPNAILFTHGKICERCVGGNFFHAVRFKCYRESYLLSSIYAMTLASARHIGKISGLISAYVTPDQFLKDKLVQGNFPAERIFSILNPFDVDQYVPHYGHTGYFVYCGRVVREKGIFTLLKAMAHLPSTRLLVVGGGEADQEAREFVDREKLLNVQFMGPKYGTELVSILNDALAVVVPTEWYDNSPLIVHQAFSLGKPAIASDIDGIPEIVSHNEDGLLFQPGSVSELTERMKALEGQPELHLRLAHNARRKAESQFTAAKRFDRLMEVIRFAQQNRI